MKFVIYNSDTYYPFAVEYDTIEEAMIEFKKLKLRRMVEFKQNHCRYSDKDYLCNVLEECDFKEYGVQ